MIIKYGETTDPNTFSAVLNRADLPSTFNPVAGAIEVVTIDLQEGRNVLVLSIDGIRTDGRNASETDRLTFKVG